jgi:hypothetical protein
MRRTSAASDDKSGVTEAIVKKTPLPLLQIIEKSCETKQAFLTAKVRTSIAASLGCTCNIFHYYVMTKEESVLSH